MATLLDTYIDAPLGIDFMVADADGHIILTHYGNAHTDDFDNMEVLEQKTPEDLELNKIGYLRIDYKADPISMVDAFEMIIPTHKDISVFGNPAAEWYSADNTEMLTDYYEDCVYVRYSEQEHIFKIIEAELN